MTHQPKLITLVVLTMGVASTAWGAMGPCNVTGSGSYSNTIACTYNSTLDEWFCTGEVRIVPQQKKCANTVDRMH